MRTIFIAIVTAILFVSACQQDFSKKVQENPVGYFEIPVQNVEQAIVFYEGVFGCTLERTIIDGNTMALFPFDENKPGITGALAQGDSYKPSINGSRLYFSVSNIDSTLAKVRQLGGKVLYPKTSIGQRGWVAEFEDIEGNRIAIHAR
jgi:hypothetical protein